MVLDHPQLMYSSRQFLEICMLFRGFLRVRNSEKITKQRVWMRSALLWAARTYVRISDNERRELKAEETHRNNEEKATPRSPNRSLSRYS